MFSCFCSLFFSEYSLCEIIDFNDSLVRFIQQIELHPWLQQREIVEYCRSKSIHIESYSPLTKGQKLKKQNNKLTKMVAKYEGKSIAQLLLRWNAQTGHVVIAKSKNSARIAENFDTLNWDISDKDMAVLDALDCDYHCSFILNSLRFIGIFRNLFDLIGNERVNLSELVGTQALGIPLRKRLMAKIGELTVFDDI